MKAKYNPADDGPWHGPKRRKASGKPSPPILKPKCPMPLTDEDTDLLRADLDALPEPSDWNSLETVECEILPLAAGVDLHLLRLTSDQWTALTTLRLAGVPVRGVGAGCVHTPRTTREIDELLVEKDFAFRESPVNGGTYLIFDQSPSLGGVS